MMSMYSSRETYDPRPEFAIVPSNPTNPILAEFRGALRNYSDKRLGLKHYIQYVTYGDVYGWSHAHRFHAQKVLTRLAALQEVSDAD
jgi:hypothetical protein